MLSGEGDGPAPLLGAEVDLRGLPFMPLDTVRLIDSDLFALSSGDEFKAAIALWCKAWQQVPAASLPDDDRVLAHLSGAGGGWRKVRAVALRGFVKCRDGRLYHPVIAEKAAAAWRQRIAQRDRAGKRWHSPGNAAAYPAAPPAAPTPASPAAVPAHIPRQSRGNASEVEVKGEELQNRGVETASRSPPAEPVDNSAHPAETAISDPENRTANGNGKGDGKGQCWSDPAWWQATANTVGRPRRPGETDEAWRDGVYAKVHEARAGA